MSFQYMALYTGDYVRDTQHLSCSEHGIYLKLLIHCWDQKGPAPLDERKLQGITNARSGDEIEAMRRVLGEFFVQMEDGWYNDRMVREVDRARAKSSAYRASGIKSGAVRKAKGTTVQPSFNVASTAVAPTTTKETTKEEKIKTKIPATSLPKDFGISECVRTWAKKEQLEPILQANFDYFVGYAKANGKRYVEWDQALQNCVRGNWAKAKPVVQQKQPWEGAINL